MLDFSWGEVMLIGGVALIVIGPKDLPKALRTVGQITTKLRRMAGEFQSQFNEAIREAELDEVRRDVEGLKGHADKLRSGFNPVDTIRTELKNAVEGRSAPSEPKPSPQTLSEATAQLKAAEAGALEPRPGAYDVPRYPAADAAPSPAADRTP